MSIAGDYILEGSTLAKYYRIRRQPGMPPATVKAVDGVSFALAKGETLGIVGESGSGKTTLTRLILKLEDPTAGDLRFHGEDVVIMKGDALLRFRRAVQAVFQNPYASLNPRLKIGRSIAEPLLETGLTPRSDLKPRVEELLVAVGLQPSFQDRYPHELSGGQRQRVAIARAMSTEPECIVLDEPVSALDMSIRAQILNLLTELQDEIGVSYIFVAHDLATVRRLSHRIAVMYLGRIVETGSSSEVCDAPLHPYTRALIANTLSADPDEWVDEVVLRGDIPSPVSIPTGCRFHPRCPSAMPVCSEVDPTAMQMQGGRSVACHLFTET